MPTQHDIARLQTMEEKAWAELQEDYYRRIFFFCRRYVSDHQTAEDITQDVFLGAVRGIESFDVTYTLDQFLFGIAKNRVIDHFRKHKMPLLPPKGGDRDSSTAWLENMVASGAVAPGDRIVLGENLERQKAALGVILKEFVAELWDQGEFQKLQVLEYLFLHSGRNKDAARRFGIEDEKAVAGIKFRAIEKLRGLARRSDPNHSLFLGLWKPGAR